MKPVRFHPDAESEMANAARWYESQKEGLGKRFLTFVQDAINRIGLNPELYPIVEGDVRRCLTRVFPYGILFHIKPDYISVIAVMHLHRDPDYWKPRGSERATQ